MAFVYGLVAFAVGAGIVVWRWVGRRNEYFDEAGAVVRRWRGPNFDALEPSDRVPSYSPGLFGVLRRHEMKPEDVAVLILDLAQRGYLQIEQISVPDAKGRGGEWSLLRRPLSESRIKALTRYETVLISRMFGEGKTVRLGDLRRGFGPIFVAVQNALYADLVKRGAFHVEPLDVKVSWRRAASGIIIMSLFAAVLLQVAVPYPGSMALAIFAVGIAVAVLSNFVGVRTAKGSEMLLAGGRMGRFLQLGTPELIAQDDARFVEFMPWALATGTAEDWVRVYGEERGVAVPEFYRVSKWTVDQVTEVEAGTLSGEMRGFYESAARMIQNSKGERRAKR